MKPTSRLRSSANSPRESLTILRPASLISPLFGVSKPPKRYSKVLLPAPEAPRNARKSPRFSSRSTPLKTSRARLPSRYVLRTAVAESSASLITQRLHRFQPSSSPGRNDSPEQADNESTAAYQKDVARHNEGRQFAEPINLSRKEF